MTPPHETEPGRDPEPESHSSSVPVGGRGATAPGVPVSGRGVAAGTGLSAPVSIWDLPEQGGRGPKPRHDRTVIAAVAVGLADAEGLDALTMRRVAAALGMGTMSLY